MTSLSAVGVIKGDNVYLEKKRNFAILSSKFVKDVFDSRLTTGAILTRSV